MTWHWPEWLSIGRPGGIVLGGSGAVMLRRLHLFSGDIGVLPWFASGTPPIIELPAYIRMRWLSPEEWRANPGILETPPDVVAERFEAGARCLIGWDDSTVQLVYHLWVTETATYIDWIFRHINVPPQHLLVFDVWVHPDYRGGNVHWAGASHACGEAVRCGRRYIFAGVEEHEYYIFATKYARLSLGLIVPHSRIVGVKMFGMKFHFTRGPSARLAEFSKRLRRMFGQQKPA
jgi:hypothetical protein